MVCFFNAKAVVVGRHKATPTQKSTVTAGTHHERYLVLLCLRGTESDFTLYNLKMERYSFHKVIGADTFHQPQTNVQSSKKDTHLYKIQYYYCQTTDTIQS